MSRHIRAQTTPTHASGFHLFTVAMTGHAEERGSTTAACNSRVYDEMPHLDINNELEMAILSAMENEYIKKSRVLDTKDGSINGLSIMILKERFSEETLIKGMKYIKENIDRDFHTLSYISRIIKSMDK